MRRASTGGSTHDLVVTGTGYTVQQPQFKPPSSLAPKKANAVFGSTARKVRIAGGGGSAPATSSSAMKRSGSVGSVRTPLVPRQTVQSGNNCGGSAFESKPGTAASGQPVICNCQHPANLAFLEDVYVQNLETEIEVLKLQNSYLEGKTTNPPPQSTSQPPQSSSMSSLRKSYNREDTVNITNPLAEAINNWPMVSGTSYGQRKHVGFHSTPPRTSNPPISSSTEQEDELFLRLEESIQREQRLEERLKKQIAENRRLSTANEEAQSRLELVNDELRLIEEKVTKERRGLLEDSVDMQRRLDELTPLLAEKEAHIARLLNEKGDLSSRLRSTKNQLGHLQKELETQKREESILSELDSEQRHEIERLNHKIRSLESEIETYKMKESSHIEEVSSLQRRLKDEETALRRESTLYRQLQEDHNAMIKQNASLSSELSKLEKTVASQKAELATAGFSRAHEREISELRAVEKSLRNEISRLEDRLRREQEAVRNVEGQLKEREFSEGSSRSELIRTQKELEGLEALSKSLSNENSGLREEKIALAEKLEYLQRKQRQESGKDVEIRQLTDSLDEFKRKYATATSQLQKDMAAQAERSLELEAIVRKVHEISEPVVRRSRSSSVASRRHYADTRTSSSVISVDSVASARRFRKISSDKE
uniref:Calponin-homology (CH) domain-containing protein n=1 Tax=Panagrellus redivivus TaxID=6233 RepID=A0A7E4VFJ9_PANRE